MRNEVLIGDCLTTLKNLPSDSVHTCVTSPPYWNLRDYEAEGQIGIEETPAEYVAKLVEVFREVRRVLHPSGTLWLNLGDSYAKKAIGSIKAKDLVGIPWMVAFALREDGWYLRSDNIWFKPNPMPEPVTDRTVRAHEFIFHFAKSDRYFYDHRAILEDFKGENEGRDGSKQSRQRNRGGRTDGFTKPNGIDPSENGGANKRSVWEIGAAKFKRAHFATFPPAIPEICIRAGTSKGGCCPKCFAPFVPKYERVVKRTVTKNDPVFDSDTGTWVDQPDTVEEKVLFDLVAHTPPCKHNEKPIPCLVLDPFAGSGTTLAVAKWWLRDYVGIELNEKYKELIDDRLRPANEVASEKGTFADMMDME
jgi:DNA modification methylase